MSRFDPIRIVCLSLGVLAVLAASELRADPRLGGRWKMSVSTNEGSREYYVDLVEEGAKLSGSLLSPRSGAYPLRAAETDGKSLRFSVDREYEGQQFTFEVKGEIGEKVVEGRLSLSGNDAGGIRMTRVGDPVGKWKVTSKSPDGDRSYQSTLEVARAAEGFSGTLTHEQGKETVAIHWNRESHERIRAEFELHLGGNAIPVGLDLGFDSPESLMGKWSVRRDDSDASGEFSARKESPAFSLVGEWKSLARTDTGDEYPSIVRVSTKDGKHRGRYEGQLGEKDYDAVELEGHRAYFELTLDIDGNPVTFVINAEATSDDVLEGRWELKDDGDVGGPWSARRVAPAKPAEKAKGESEEGAVRRRPQAEAAAPKRSADL